MSAACLAPDGEDLWQRLERWHRAIVMVRETAESNPERRRPVLTGAAKDVLYVLLKHAELMEGRINFAESGRLDAWVGTRRLADLSGHSRQYIQRDLLPSLVDGGVLVLIEVGRGRRGDRYAFGHKWLETVERSLERQGVLKLWPGSSALEARATGPLQAIEARATGPLLNASSASGRSGPSSGAVAARPRIRSGPSSGAVAARPAGPNTRETNKTTPKTALARERANGGGFSSGDRSKASNPDSEPYERTYITTLAGVPFVISEKIADVTALLRSQFRKLAPEFSPDIILSAAKLAVSGAQKRAAAGENTPLPNFEAMRGRCEKVIERRAEKERHKERQRVQQEIRENEQREWQKRRDEFTTAVQKLEPPRKWEGSSEERREVLREIYKYLDFAHDDIMEAVGRWESGRHQWGAEKQKQLNESQLRRLCREIRRERGGEGSEGMHYIDGPD